MMRKSWLLIFLFLAIGAYLLTRRQPSPPSDAAEPRVKRPMVRSTPVKPVPPPPPTKVVAAPIVARPPAPNAASGKKPFVTKYVLEGNLAIVQGDILAGAIVDEKAPITGYVKLPDLQLWPGGVIPYSIAPSLPAPERVQAALAMFEGTAVQFVPYTDQEDSVVFVDSPGVCKSYVGRVGGHQPILLSNDCGPHEIAHELMHALGFLHEQNRADRDAFVQVNFDNIDDKYRDNFEKFPTDYMKVSGLGDFDFDSVMIYPTSMFA
jgi:hypothetical protein